MKFKWRAWVRRLTVLNVILFGSFTPVALIVSLCFVALGMFLHIWSIGCLVRNTQLTTWGPYRFVRHPFYLANLCIDLGLCAAGSGHIWTAIYLFGVYSLLFYFVYIKRMRKEEVHLTALFPKEYPEYISHVPQFLPLFFKRYPASDKGFSFTILIAAGNEITRVMRLLIYPMVLYFILRRFPYGIFCGVLEKMGVLENRLTPVRPGDFINGFIGYPEIIMIGVILVLSVVSIFVHKSSEKAADNK